MLYTVSRPSHQSSRLQRPSLDQALNIPFVMRVDELHSPLIPNQFNQKFKLIVKA